MQDLGILKKEKVSTKSEQPGKPKTIYAQSLLQLGIYKTLQCKTKTNAETDN